MREVPCLDQSPIWSVTLLWLLVCRGGSGDRATRAPACVGACRLSLQCADRDPYRTPTGFRGSLATRAELQAFCGDLKGGLHGRGKVAAVVGMLFSWMQVERDAGFFDQRSARMTNRKREYVEAMARLPESERKTAEVARLMKRRPETVSKFREGLNEKGVVREDGRSKGSVWRRVGRVGADLAT